MNEKDKEIEDLKNKLESSNASWTRYFHECEALKQELARYKELVKVQSNIINNN